MSSTSQSSASSPPPVGLFDLALSGDEDFPEDVKAEVPAVADEPGMVIAGRYVLKSVLGEGGTGHVWWAEQTQPVKREVALKLIRSGLVTQPVSARFNREHQVLARMEHPNIAAVLDAGELPDGRTYFVMELVHGSPVTTWCKEHQTPISERLEIFLQACLAVQHAHQKGILHRDIKPSNVMVTQFDDKPLVKVIDFGISKALEGDLATGSDMTLRGMVLGTPRYMSPEQAGLTGEDVDTRADVYALGVLLYELLTGSTPVEEAHEKDTSLQDLLHRVRHTETELPSRRVTHITAKQPVDTKILVGQLRGDLDWITMRALQKDREQRYPTVVSLADDVRRHLRDEPVSAGPPGVGYRLKKWYVRHRSNITATAAVVISLGGGIAATSMALRREGEQRLEAMKQRETAQNQTDLAKQVSDQLTELLSNARKHAEAGMNTQMLRRLADECAAGMPRFAGQPVIEAQLADQLAQLYNVLEERPRALPWYQRRWELLCQTEGEESRNTLQARFELGWRSLAMNARKVAITHLRATAGGYAALPDPDEDSRRHGLLTRKELARALSADGQHEEALKLFEEVMREKGQDKPNETASWLKEQADCFRAADKLAESSSTLQRALDLLPKDEESASMRAFIMGSVATVSHMQKHYDEALEASAERLQLYEAELGANHPRVLGALLDHAFLACKCPGCPGGEEAARRALLMAKTAGHETRLSDAWTALSEVLRMSHRREESEQAVRDAIAEVSRTKAEHWRVLEFHRRLGDLMVGRSDFESAQKEYETAAAEWFAPSTGRAIEKERLIFESYLTFWEQAKRAESPVASDEKQAEWRGKLAAWEAAQPAGPAAREQNMTRAQ
ncbi:MAG: serine/threonine-protein kinase [Verrucomicrobiota bacterium]